MRIENEGKKIIAIFISFILHSPFSILHLLGGIIFISGCSLLTQSQVVDGSREPVILQQQTLSRNTLWQGNIRIQGVITIPKDVALKLASGTRVEFLPQDKNQDGVGDSGLVVNGRIIAQGEPGRLIEFTSGISPAKPFQWGGIQIEYSPESLFKFCRFSGADWAIHAHFSDLEVTHCILEHNSGGMRFRSGPVKITYSLIQENNVGLRLRTSNPVIQYNTIRQNHVGIYVRENSRPEISYNNLAGNTDYSIELEETQTQDVNCPHNWWGDTDKHAIRKLIYDHQHSPGTGRVLYEPIATDIFPVAP